MKYPIFYLLFFSFSLALFRIIPHPPNFTPVLSVAIMAPMILRNKLYGSAIPIIAMFLSDIILGFHVYQFAEKEIQKNNGPIHHSQQINPHTN